MPFSAILRIPSENFHQERDYSSFDGGSRLFNLLHIILISFPFKEEYIYLDQNVSNILERESVF